MRISYLGVNNKLRDDLQKNVLLTNRFALTWIFLIIPYIIMFSFHDLIGVFILSGLIGVHVVVIYLNSIGWYTLSRMFEGIFPQLAIFLLGVFLYVTPNEDKISSFYMLNLAFLAIPFMIFSLREFPYILVSVVLSVTYFYSFQYFNELLHFQESSDLYNTRFFQIYNYSIAAGLIMIGFLYIKYNSDYYYERVKLQQQKLSTIFNSVIDGVVITDLEGNYLEANYIETEHMGLSKAELLRQNFCRMYFRVKHEQCKMIENIKKHGFNQTEIVFDYQKRKAVPLEIISKRIPYESQEAVLHVIRDISERKRLEREIVKAIYETEEKERNRFSQELHDGLGAMLSGIKMHLSFLRKGRGDQAQHKEVIQKSMDLISEAVDTAKGLAKNIRPHQLDRFGLVASVQSFIDQLKGANMPNIQLYTDHYDDIINKDAQHVLFRVITELTNNSLKHSKAKNIEIRLFNVKNEVYLLYSDDGVGFRLEEVTDKKEGLGLNNMFNRINAVDGKYAINAIPGSGMDFIVQITAINAQEEQQQQ